MKERGLENLITPPSELGAELLKKYDEDTSISQFEFINNAPPPYIALVVETVLLSNLQLSTVTYLIWFFPLNIQIAPPDRIAELSLKLELVISIYQFLSLISELNALD